MIKQITITQYATARGISVQAVTKMIRQKGKLPGVQKVERFGKFYLLTIDLNKWHYKTPILYKVTK